jgi:hypothetical protein
MKLSRTVIAAAATLFLLGGALAGGGATGGGAAGGGAATGAGSGPGLGGGSKTADPLNKSASPTNKMAAPPAGSHKTNGYRVKHHRSLNQ